LSTISQLGKELQQSENIKYWDNIQNGHKLFTTFQTYIYHKALEISGNEPLKICVDCVTNSGAAEMHTADKHKMAGSPQQKAMSVLWYRKTKSVIQVQRCYHLEYSEQAPGR
jgi:hypothetical protein